jgi:hypothetical protein
MNRVSRALLARQMPARSAPKTELIIVGINISYEKFMNLLDSRLLGYIPRHPTQRIFPMAPSFSPTAPSSSPDVRPSSLGRRLVALAGAGGALVAGAEAEAAVTYAPTAGVVAAGGIPGFSFVDASNVTLGNLRGPASAGAVGWDVDGAGGDNFFLVNSVTLFGSLSAAANSNSLLVDPSIDLQNIATGGAVGALQATWRTGKLTLTYVAGTGAVPGNFSLGTSGQFGFRFTEASNTYYGWGSLLIDGQAIGQGFKITEAYYQSTPGTAIDVGAVPVPEPTGIALLALGSAGVMAWRFRRRPEA